MATTDTTERGLETRITAILTAERPESGPNGQPIEQLTWIQGDPADYDRANCVDLNQFSAFLQATQPEVAAALSMDADTPTRSQFLARLKREVRSRGIIDMLRKGISHHQHHVDLFYGTPTPGNATAEERYTENRFSVTRQLGYSNDERQRALDLATLHQRPAHRHLRAQEQPHQADGERRRPAVPASPQPS